MEQDKLVSAIFDTARRTDATPSQRKAAIIRAGMIAQAYNYDCDLAEKVFSSLTDSLNNNEQAHSISRSNDSRE